MHTEEKSSNLICYVNCFEWNIAEHYRKRTWKHEEGKKIIYQYMKIISILNVFLNIHLPENLTVFKKAVLFVGLGEHFFASSTLDKQGSLFWGVSALFIQNSSFVSFCWTSD